MSVPVSPRRHQLIHAITEGQASHKMAQLGKELWSVELSDATAVDSLFKLSNGNIVLKTKDEVIAVHPDHGAIEWRESIAPTSPLLHLPDDNFVYLSQGGTKLVLRSADSGREQKSIDVHTKPLSKPILVSDQILLLEDHVLFSYNPKLEKNWEYATASILEIFPWKNGIALRTDAGFEFLDLKGTFQSKLAKDSFKEFPPKKSMVLGDQLLVQFRGQADQLISLSAHTPKELTSSLGIQETPLETTSGEFVCALAPVNQGHGIYNYPIATINSHRDIHWQIEEKEKARSFVADKEGNIFIAFSQNLDTFRLAQNRTEHPTCYIKGFNKNGQEFYSFVADAPIFSPLAQGSHGELYFFSNGKLHAIK